MKGEEVITTLVNNLLTKWKALSKVGSSSGSSQMSISDGSSTPRASLTVSSSTSSTGQFAHHADDLPLPTKRKSMVGKMMDALVALVADPDTDDEIKIVKGKATEMEAAVFDYSRGDENSPEYNIKIREILHYVKNNLRLRNRFMDGEISGKDFCSLGKSDLETEEDKKQQDEWRAQALEAKRADLSHAKQKEAMKKFGKTSEGLFACGKCKSTNTDYYAMQTRSSDEPMTLYVSRFLSPFLSALAIHYTYNWHHLIHHLRETCIIVFVIVQQFHYLHRLWKVMEAIGLYYVYLPLLSTVLVLVRI